MGNPKELVRATEVYTAKKSIEILSVWECDKKLMISLKIGAYDDIRTWGIVIADIVRHLSDATHEINDNDINDTAQAILDICVTELENPTDRLYGYFDSEGKKEA